MEVTHTAYYIDSFTWRGLETTSAASVVYLCIALCVVGCMALVEKRVRIPGMMARGR
jgi:glutamate/aspartate transport system permease protein